jgi:O-antigen ligase
MATAALLERASKAATAASIVLLVILQLFVHPDLTPALRVSIAAALAVGWLPGRRFTAPLIALWVFMAPLAPATLRALTGREGPVLDLLWMSGLAGTLLRVSPWSAWSASVPPLWRVLVAGSGLTLALSWPAIVGREIGFVWSGFHDIGAINSWAMLSAPQAASWVQSVALTQLLAWLWFDWLVGQRTSTPGAVAPGYAWCLGAWCLGVTVASVAALYQGMVDMSFANLQSWAVLRRATGTMLDGNAYGMAAAIAGPIGYVWLRTRPTSWPPAAPAVLLVNLLGLWMSGSRTAFLCGAVGLAGLAVGLRTQVHVLRGRLGAVAAAAAIAAVLIFVAGAAGPLERLGAIPASAAGFDWLWNRLGYGTAAARMLRDFPFTGVGIGAYHLLVPDYSRMFTDVTLPFDNAQNWWRHQVAELGLLGAFPVVAFSALLGARVLTVGRGAADGPTAWLCRGLLLGLGLASLLGMPTQSPVVLLGFFLLAAPLVPSPAGLPASAAARAPEWSPAGPGVTAAAAGPTDAPIPHTEAPVPPHAVIVSRPPGWLAVVAVVCLLCAVGKAAGDLILARRQLAVPERALRAGRDYVAGAYTVEESAGVGSFRWTGTKARFVWKPETRLLAVTLWAQHPDIAQTPVHVILATQCQILFEQDLTSTAVVRIGLELSDDARMVDATVRASRTWQPAAFGAQDTRRLGVGVSAQFLDDRSQLNDRAVLTKLQECS